MYEDIFSKTHEYKHGDDQTPTTQVQAAIYSNIWTYIMSLCEQRRVLLTYPPKHAVIFKNAPATEVSLPCV